MNSLHSALGWVFLSYMLVNFRSNWFVVFPILMAIVSWYGCHAQTNVPIKGKIQVTEEWKPKIYLIHPKHFNEIAADYLGQVVDSAAINEDGSFSFDAISNTKDKSLFIIAIQPESSRYANHLIDDVPSKANYMPLIYGPGETLNISADANSFQSSFSIKLASKENLSLLTLRDIRKNAFEKYIQRTSDLEDDSLLIEKEKAYSDYLGDMMSFADSASILESAMLAIRWISPTNDYERIPEFIYRQCQKWSPLHPDNTFVKEFCIAADKSNLPIMSGELMPDIHLPLVSGDTVNLFSMLGKKLTLLDLWASWCAPCRKETREELIPLWNHYHDKGFQIIGYSIDANEGPWKNAIVKDGSKWIHASHLTGDSTPFMDALRISTIPANYLLDVDGKVLAKNLHGEELRDFMEKYFR